MYNTHPYNDTPYNDGGTYSAVVDPSRLHALGDNRILVPVTRPLLSSSALGYRDALNPDNWTVSDPASGRVYEVSKVEKRNTTGMEFILTVCGRLEPLRVVEVSLSTDVSTLDGSMVSTIPGAVTAIRRFVRTGSGGRATGRDVAFPFGRVDAASVGGPETESYHVDGTGDYAKDDKTAQYRKRLLRRITANPSDYTVYNGRYGAGVQQYKGKTGSPAAIEDAVDNIKKQCLLEDFVASVDVTVDTTRGHIPVFKIRVTTTDGVTLENEQPFPTE